MKVTFCINATTKGFVNFLQDFTKGVEMEPGIPYDNQQVKLLPYFAGPPNNVATPIPPEELASIPPGAVHPLAGTMFRIGDVVFASVPHEHSDVQGRIVALFFSDYPDEHDPLVTHTKTDERVAIGFKWTQIDEKLRVTMGCYEPVAGDYFARLLKEISQIWPESREAIDEHLKGLGEQSQEQATTAPPGVTFFAQGRWKAESDDFAELGKALKTFHEAHADSIGGFVFCIPEEAATKTDTLWRWPIGGYRDKSFYQHAVEATDQGAETVAERPLRLRGYRPGETKRNDPSYKRPPYAEVVARDVGDSKKGLELKLFYEDNPHAGVMRDYLQALSDALKRNSNFSECLQDTTNKPYGPTEKTFSLAHDIKALKDKNPTWSQSVVATHLNLPLETVRYAYRLMQWKWERADRVRAKR